MTDEKKDPEKPETEFGTVALISEKELKSGGRAPHDTRK